MHLYIYTLYIFYVYTFIPHIQGTQTYNLADDEITGRVVVDRAVLYSGGWVKNIRHGEGYMEYANGNTIQVKLVYYMHILLVHTHVYVCNTVCEICCVSITHSGIFIIYRDHSAMASHTVTSNIHFTGVLRVIILTTVAGTRMKT